MVTLVTDKLKQWLLLLIALITTEGIILQPESGMQLMTTEYL